MSLQSQGTDDLFFTWQLNMHDDESHAITDEEFVHGQRKNDGLFEAICGTDLYLGDSFAAPGRTCQRCLLFIRARRSLRSVEERLNAPGSPFMRRVRSMFCHQRARHAAGSTVQDMPTRVRDE